MKAQAGTKAAVEGALDWEQENLSFCLVSLLGSFDPKAKVLTQNISRKKKFAVVSRRLTDTAETAASGRARSYLLPLSWSMQLSP